MDLVPNNNSNGSIDPNLPFEEMSQEQLSAHIVQLYAQDGKFFTSYKRNRKQLAEALAVMKEKVSKSGCNGGWTGFLANANIPRKSADRLVAAYHVRLLTPSALRAAAEEAGVDLYSPSVVAALKVINEELCNGEPTMSEIDALVDRLEGIRFQKKPKKSVVAAKSSSAETGSSSTHGRSESGQLTVQVADWLRRFSASERYLHLETFVREITNELGEEFDVVITRRAATAAAA